MTSFMFYEFTGNSFQSFNCIYEILKQEQQKQTSDCNINKTNNNKLRTTGLAEI